jgi:hypothetical protein
MRINRRLLVTSGFVIILLGLGVTDAVLTRNLNMIPESAGGTESSVPTVVETGPDVFEVLNSLGIVTQGTREEGLLEQVVPAEVKVEKRVILKGDDRLGYFAWLESPDVTVYLSAMKDALRSSFSSQMRDLVDEVQNIAGKPTRDVLSFIDPSIHEERILFVRIGTRLYEFHIPEGKEPETQTLMDELTQ